MHRRLNPVAWRQAARLIAAVAAALTVAGSPSCHKRPPPGTCTQDIDCPAAFDCRAGRCVHRERLQLGGPTRKTEAAPDPVAASPPADPEPQVIHATPDAGLPPMMKRPPPVRPAEPPSSYPSSPPPSGPEPMWKQRRKNI